MRKGVLIGLVLMGLAGLMQPEPAAAQPSPSFIYTVKFVCGTQMPLPTNPFPPVEPPVKPGNYATVINIENLTPNVSGVSVASWNASVAGGSGASGPVSLTLGQLQTADVTCNEIAKLALTIVPHNRPFITGFVNLITQTQLAVTAVYTSQGCTFPGESGGGEGRATCGGPTSIEVVPQTAVPFAVPPT